MKEYTDLMLDNMDYLVRKVYAENSRQLIKWGVQERTAFEWLTYLAEEVGEVAKAISEHEYRDGYAEEVINEAIQVATLSLKIAEMFKEASKDHVGSDGR